MNPELISALVLFAFVSTVTPGPNNLMLLASGANFGFQRTIPHMLGIACGVVVMVLLLGTGLIQLFEQVSWSYTVLKVLCIIYMLYLAFKISRSAPTDLSSEGQSNPFSFMQAALFQWVNPKAWSMALTAITIYSPERTLESLMIVAAAFGIVNLPSISLWVVMGKQLRFFLSNTRRLQAFNWSMATLLVASLYPVLQL